MFAVLQATRKSEPTLAAVEMSSPPAAVKKSRRVELSTRTPQEGFVVVGRTCEPMFGANRVPLLVPTDEENH